MPQLTAMDSIRGPEIDLLPDPGELSEMIQRGFNSNEDVLDQMSSFFGAIGKPEFAAVDTIIRREHESRAQILKSGGI